MASKHGLSGEVDNRTDGVYILVQGDTSVIDSFTNDILHNAPPASHIKSIEMSPVLTAGYQGFSITRSKNPDNNVTEVSPDIAVCRECLEDMENDPERIGYPFVNCTNCGPRFTIIEELPYDRPFTTMNSFVMCSKCKSEYGNILDRRFHAQPIACNSCGPVYKYFDHSGCLTWIDEILDKISRQIESGKTIALKGLGGYHLLCDAFNNNAVGALRNRKLRDSKPFAVMFRDIQAASEYCFIGQNEEKELLSWRRPVVILRQKNEVSPAVSNGLNTTGVILPYMPIHYLLFRKLSKPAIVFTSGNLSDEPVIISDMIAENELIRVADSVVSYNREILNRADDSVVRFIDNRISVIRRSRGFVPRPVDLRFDVEGILALGAEQKNSFCIGRGRQAIMSQYIGDLKNRPVFDFFSGSIERFKKLFRFKPSLTACDLHPGYLSSQYAESLEDELGIPLIRVQHHHAHIASCMAENCIDEEVIGISFDGTGLGTDGNIWGGEFLIADLNNFKRYTHFDYIPLPGGDRAIDEPWRIAFSFLYKYLGNDFDFESLPVFRMLGKEKLSAIREMLEKNINTPLSSGAGRLFDAVSAITGLCSSSTFDSEAPMRLESVIREETDDFYPYSAGKPVLFDDTIKEIVRDIHLKPVSLISAKFHNTIARVILDVSRQIRIETSINRIILSGGVFQNKYLLEKSLYLLGSDKFETFTHHFVPANDGGISLGQLVIASKMRKTCV